MRLPLGKFAGADYLLHVLITRNQKLTARDKASVRLVEVATGQVKVEDEVALGADSPCFVRRFARKSWRPFSP